MTFHTDLSDCLLRDSLCSPLYDWCPAGGLIITEGNRIKVSTDMIQPIPIRGWESHTQIDRAIYRLLRKAAESRLGGILRTDTRKVWRVISQGVSSKGRQVVCHPNEAQHLLPRQESYSIDRIWPSKVLPTRLILVMGYPEEMGLLVGTDISAVGIGLRNPELVAGCYCEGPWAPWKPREEA